MEKMKKWVMPSFNDEFGETPAKKQKTTNKDRILESSPKTKQQSSTVNIPKIVPNINAEDWMKHFDPKTTDDLAVHIKKVQEVDAWLCHTFKSRGDILLISGPVGSGKTATVQVLAEKYNVRIREWITPHDTEIPASDGKFGFCEKQANVFKKFLVDAGCYTSLLQSSNSRTLLLVEDYPNTFLRSLSEFTDALHHYRERRASAPIVFICTEYHSESRDTAFSLFSNIVKEQFKIHHISFNSISATGLKMALKRVSQIISKTFSCLYNTPSSELIDCVANSSAGDVRSAVLNLHFASLKGITMKPSQQCIISKDKKLPKKKKVANKFQTIGKNETVTLLHAVGRVLNPKLYEDGGRKKFTHAPLEILEQFSSQPASFINFLHENYPPHFSSTDQVTRAAAAISDADLMLSEWREKFCQEYGLYMAVAGLMVANKTPVSAWNPVRGPKCMRRTYMTSKDIPLLDETQLYHGKVLISDYKTYCNIINSKRPTSTAQLIMNDSQIHTSEI